MGTPLYSTDIIPLTSRPTLTVMDDGDYFVILDTSTGKISKILKTNIMTALKITYDNTSGLTAANVQAALDELVVNLGSSDSAILALSGRLDTLEGTGEGSVEKAIDDLAGAGRTNETVKGNADAISLRELLSNKKSTLLENSETYFPNQRAVNEGLNQTMAEIMGYAPRNLMEVFGTLTVPATFEALRASIAGGDFSHLRLGDYIDLASFTVNNWYNGAAYDSATGAWDTTVTVTKNLSYQNTRVEIVGFDDYYYVGNTAYPSSHHVTFQFKNIPLRAPMHKLNVSPYYQTSQNYKGSDLVTIGLANFYAGLADNFGIGTANETIPYSVDRILGTVSSWEWCGPEKLFLPTGMNIFGHPGFAQEHYGVGTQSQFPLYALNPNKRMKRYNGSVRNTWWLAEPSAGSSSAFTYVSAGGGIDGAGSYISFGVAPAFLI
jgi:hypothetical protein